MAQLPRGYFWFKHPLQSPILQQTRPLLKISLQNNPNNNNNNDTNTTTTILTNNNNKQSQGPLIKLHIIYYLYLNMEKAEDSSRLACPGTRFPNLAESLLPARRKGTVINETRGPPARPGNNKIHSSVVYEDLAVRYGMVHPIHIPAICVQTYRPTSTYLPTSHQAYNVHIR